MKSLKILVFVIFQILLLETQPLFAQSTGSGKIIAPDSFAVGTTISFVFTDQGNMPSWPEPVAVKIIKTDQCVYIGMENDVFAFKCERPAPNKMIFAMGQLNDRPEAFFSDELTFETPDRGIFKNHKGPYTYAGNFTVTSPRRQ